MTADSFGVNWIEVDFADGEMPAAAKFDGWALQTESIFNSIALAIGDVHGEVTDDNLFATTVDMPYIGIVNLARAIGPMSVLNPIRYAGVEVTVDDFDPAHIPIRVHEFNIVEIGNDNSHNWPVPIQYDGFGTPSIHTSFTDMLHNDVSATIFDTLKASLDQLATAGDYFVDLKGTVHCFTKTPSSPFSVDTLEYTTESLADSYLGASINISTAVTRSDATHLVLTNDEQLPAVFDTLGVGAAIPDGFVKLWCVDDNEYVSDISFNVGDPTRTELEIVKGTLEAGKTYKVVTAGTTLVETIATLRDRVDNLYNQPSSHIDLANRKISPAEILSVWGRVYTAPESLIEGNDHPQYLARYGYASGIDPDNYDNAIMGNLFIAASSGAYDNPAISSYGIFFGDNDSARSLKYSSTKDCLYWGSGDNTDPTNTIASTKLRADTNANTDYAELASDGLTIFDSYDTDYTSSITMVNGVLTVANNNSMSFTCNEGSFTVNAQGASAGDITLTAGDDIHLNATGTVLIEGIGSTYFQLSADSAIMNSGVSAISCIDHDITITGGGSSEGTCTISNFKYLAIPNSALHRSGGEVAGAMYYEHLGAGSGVLWIYDSVEADWMSVSLS